MSETVTEPQTTTTTAETQTTTESPKAEETSLLGTQQPAPEPEKVPEQKTEPEKKEPEYVPLTAEALKLPEGFSVDEGVRDQFLTVVNSHKIPTEAVAALVELQAGMAKKASETASQLWQDTQTTWRNEVVNHPEIGGQKLNATLTGIGKLVDQYGSPEFRDVMNITGAGNNFHVVSFLHKIAQKLTEGTFAKGTPSAPASDLASTFYPNSNMK